MKTHRVGAFGYQITRFGLINAYLVEEADGLTLIDCLLENCEHRILAAAASLDRGSICRILLTHAHVDHIGSLDALAAALGPSTEVAIGRRESSFLPKLPVQDLSLLSKEPQDPVRGKFPGAKTQPTRLLDNGDRVGSLRVLATPGHTPGHISFLDERDSTLYAGDAIGTLRGKVTVAGFPPWFFPNVGTWHQPTAIASIRSLLPLAIRTLAAGHGRTVVGSSDLLQGAVDRASSR